ASIDAGGDVNATTHGGDLTVMPQSTIDSGADVTFSARNRLTIGSLTTLDADGAVKLSGESDVTLAGIINAGTSLNVDGGNDVSLIGPATASGGMATLNAGDDLSLSAKLTASGAVILTASQGDATLSNQVIAGGDLSVMAGD